MKLTRIILTSLLYGSCLSAFGQEYKTVVTHDRAGNIIKTRVIVQTGARVAAPSIAKDSTQLPAPEDFKIYPNPANRYIYLEGKLPQGVNEAKIVFLTITGQIVKTDIYRGEMKTLPVQDLKPGVYLLELRYSEKERNTYKIIISN